MARFSSDMLVGSDYDDLIDFYSNETLENEALVSEIDSKIDSFTEEVAIFLLCFLFRGWEGCAVVC